MNSASSTSCCNFDDMRVTFDQVCECIPFVSTITMIIGAIQKYLYVPDMELNGSLKENHYYTHLKNKDFEQSWPLFIPGFDFVVKICSCCSSEAPETSATSTLTHVVIQDEDISRLLPMLVDVMLKKPEAKPVKKNPDLKFI